MKRVILFVLLFVGISSSNIRGDEGAPVALAEIILQKFGTSEKYKSYICETLMRSVIAALQFKEEGETLGRAVEAKMLELESYGRIKRGTPVYENLRKSFSRIYALVYTMEGKSTYIKNKLRLGCQREDRNVLTNVLTKEGSDFFNEVRRVEKERGLETK